MDVIHKKPLAESERAFSFSHIVVVNEATDDGDDDGKRYCYGHFRPLSLPCKVVYLVR